MGRVLAMPRGALTISIDVEILWGEPIPFEATTDRKLLAFDLEQRVRGMMSAA